MVSTCCRHAVSGRGDDALSCHRQGTYRYGTITGMLLQATTIASAALMLTYAAASLAPTGGLTPPPYGSGDGL